MHYAYLARTKLTETKGMVPIHFVWDGTDRGP